MEYQINLPNEGIASLVYSGIARTRNPEELIERDKETLRFSKEVYGDVIKLLTAARIAFNPFSPDNPGRPINPLGRAA